MAGRPYHTDSMEEIIVAEPDRPTIVAAAVATTFLVVAAGVNTNWQVRVVLIAMGIAVVYRMRQMKLSVTRSSVVVVNFWRYELDLGSVRIVDEKDLAWPKNDVGDPNTTSVGMPTGASAGGRALYLMDDSGQKVRVRLAPVYGNRLDTISEDLYRAVAIMKEDG